MYVLQITTTSKFNEVHLFDKLDDALEKAKEKGTEQLDGRLYRGAGEVLYYGKRAGYWDVDDGTEWHYVIVYERNL